MSEFKINGNRINFSIPITDKEDFLIERYIWPTAVIEGKDQELSATNNIKVTNTEESIHVEMQFKADVNLQTAYDAALAKRKEIQDWLNGRLKTFYDLAPSWAVAIDNLIAAMELAPKFEGGE